MDRHEIARLMEDRRQDHRERARQVPEPLTRTDLLRMQVQSGTQALTSTYRRLVHTALSLWAENARLRAIYAEGHREGVSDGLTYAAEWLIASGHSSKGKAGFLVGLAHLARRGVDLPAIVPVAAPEPGPGASDGAEGTCAPPPGRKRARKGGRRAKSDA